MPWLRASADFSPSGLAGFARNQFADAWNRYCPQVEPLASSGR